MKLFYWFQEYFGGDCDVVILPSGSAVRIKHSVVTEAEKESEKKIPGKRKRKQSEAISGLSEAEPATPVKTATPAYEVFGPGWQLKSPTKQTPPTTVPQIPAQNVNVQVIRRFLVLASKIL